MSKIGTLVDDPETSLCSTPEPSVAGVAVLSAVVVGMTAATVYRRGAFYPGDALGVVVTSLILVALALWRGRGRVPYSVALTMGGLTAWWLSRAVTQQSAVAFLPLGASFLGFLAAFLVIRRLEGDDPSRVVMAIVGIGSISAAAGVAGVLWRFQPLAQQSGHYWEVATTLTYPGAAAVLFAISLLVSMSLDLSHRLIRAGVCLCLAGLIGTQSRWDLLALVCGALVVPSRRWSAALWPLSMGLLAGLAVTASAAGRTSSVWSGVVVLLAVMASTLFGRKDRSEARSWMTAAGIAVMACGVALVMVLAPLGHGPRQSANQSQTLAWSASSQAWRTSVLTGVGPPKITTSNDSVDTSPAIASDGYLVITADSGLVGLLLLLGVGVVVAFSFRRRDLVSSCAIGAVVAFAVAGAVDFSWQLPAVALLGGSVAGLSSGHSGHRVELMTGADPERGWRPRRRPAAVWVAGVVVALTVQLVVGFAHNAGGLSRTQGVEPPPSATPGAPGQVILGGQIDATDPHMVTDSGRYYLYTSEGTTFMNVPLRIGSKPGHWGKAIDVLPHLPSWAEPGLTWAPDVHKVAGGWALYFTALLRGVNPFTHCIGSAFAASASGPFVATNHPLICQLSHRGSIDARVFVQPDNHLVLLWKSEDNANPSVPGPDQNGYTGIYAQSLSANGRSLLGNPVKIFSPSQPWEGTIVEAPDMVEAWGTYWLFYSGNWYDSSSYGIGVAQCQTPFGPCSDPRPTPFLGSNLQGAGPGESSLFVDGSGVYLLYNPFKANDPGPVIPRPAVMTRIGFTPQGPYLAAF